MDDIAFQFRLKEDSIGQLDELLSINISKRHIGGKGEYWVKGSEKSIVMFENVESVNILLELIYPRLHQVM